MPNTDTERKLIKVSKKNYGELLSIKSQFETKVNEVISFNYVIGELIAFFKKHRGTTKGTTKKVVHSRCVICGRRHSPKYDCR